MKHFSFEVIEPNKIDMVSIDPEKIELRYSGELGLDIPDYAATQAVRRQYNSPFFTEPDFNVMDAYFSAIDKTCTSVVLTPKGYRASANLHVRVLMKNNTVENIPVIMDISPEQATSILDRFFSNGAQGLNEDTQFMLKTIYESWKLSGKPMDEHINSHKY